MSDDKKAEPQEQEPQADGRGWRLVKLDVLKNPPTALAASLYVFATLFVLMVLVLVGIGLLASFQIAYETLIGKFEQRIEAAKVLFPILLALVGGPLLIWRVITAHIQAQATRHQADTGREAHYTSLFTRAVEQLGATREVKELIEINDGTGGKEYNTITKTEPNLEVRLGAIYALDRVARDSERDHWPIMEVLCAYVRNQQNTGAPKLLPAGVDERSEQFGAWRDSITKPRVDVQAVLNVVGQRLGSNRKRETERKLKLDLSGANLQGALFDEGHFETANFAGAHLEQASFEQAYLQGTRFFAANLSDANFEEAQLADAVFMGAQLTGAYFSGAKLNGATFLWAKATGAFFGNADVIDVSFGGASLRRAYFDGGPLRGTTFERADLVEAQFVGVDFAGTKLIEVDLSTAKLFDPQNLSLALGDVSTKLPEGIERPTMWSNRQPAGIDEVLPVESVAQ